jgi:hypothetical protein
MEVGKGIFHDKVLVGKEDNAFWGMFVGSLSRGNDKATSDVFFN